MKPRCEDTSGCSLTTLIVVVLMFIELPFYMQRTQTSAGQSGDFCVYLYVVSFNGPWT